MESTIKTWKTSRELILKLLNTYTLEELNFIPKGFSNNIIWNAGHIIVAQQLLVYRCTENEDYLPEGFFEKYAPGSKPTGETTQKEVDEIKNLLMKHILQTEKDLNANLFKKYTPRQTQTGFHIANLQEALEFNNYHEALHLGVMLSLRKFLLKP